MAVITGPVHWISLAGQRGAQLAVYYSLSKLVGLRVQVSRKPELFEVSQPE